MIAAVVLLVVAVAFRVVLGIPGSSSDAWWHNFSPLAAIALCGAIYFPRHIATALPMVVLLISDLILNAYYRVPLVTAAMLPQYVALGLISGFGWLLRSDPRPTLVLSASAAGSAFFFLITNAGSWLAQPLYPKSASGLTQALTVGIPGYPPTWTFFRNSLFSDLLFTLLFIACFHFGRHRRTEAVQQPAAW